MLLCPQFYSHRANLCTAEGEALHLPQEGARAILRLLGGARVSLHHKIVIEEREVRVSLALQSPHLKVPTLGWQKIRMLLISKGQKKRKGGKYLLCYIVQIIPSTNQTINCCAISCTSSLMLIMNLYSYSCCLHQSVFQGQLYLTSCLSIFQSFRLHQLPFYYCFFKIIMKKILEKMRIRILDKDHFGLKTTAIPSFEFSRSSCFARNCSFRCS